MSDRIIFSGPPGTFWTNNIGKVQYQFIAELKETCGVCLQYHTKISFAWAIPFVCGCRSIQRQVKPGGTSALPFSDFRKLLDEMDDAGKERAIGLANYTLLAAGLVEWEDIVTPNCVIQLHGVMRRKRLSVEQMIAAGVSRASAESARAILDRERAAIPAFGDFIARSLSDEELLSLTKQRVVAALGPADASRVTTKITRGANGRPSASFSCPADLREKLRRYILDVQGQSDH